MAHVAPRRLKNAAIRSAQCALQLDKRAAAYYEKKRAEGKGNKQALHALTQGGSFVVAHLAFCERHGQGPAVTVANSMEF